MVFRKKQRVICKLHQRRLVLICLGCSDPKQTQSDIAVLPFKPDLEPHTGETVLNHALKLTVLSLHDHLFIFLGLFSVRNEVVKHFIRRFSFAMKTKFAINCLLLRIQYVFQIRGHAILM